jgi:hypothetical protein
MTGDRTLVDGYSVVRSSAHVTRHLIRERRDMRWSSQKSDVAPLSNTKYLCGPPTDITKTAVLDMKLSSRGTLSKGLNLSPSGERVSAENRKPSFGPHTQFCFDSTGRRLLILTDRGELELHEFEIPPRGKGGDFRRCDTSRLWEADLALHEPELALAARDFTSASWSNLPSLYRPPPTPIDAVISSEDALLLQYAYCGYADDELMFTLFPLLSIDYGLAVRSPILRSAMLCWCASQLGASFEKRKSFHYMIGLRLLARRLNDPTTLDEADFFATFILAQISPSSSLRVLLTNGYHRILRHVSAHRTSASEMLSIFGPFALDDEEFATQLSSRHSDLKPLGQGRSSRPVKWSKVASRLRYGRFAKLTTLCTGTALRFLVSCDGMSNMGGSSNECTKLSGKC